MTAAIHNLWDYRKPEDQQAVTKRLSPEPVIYLTENDVAAIALFGDEMAGMYLAPEKDPA